MNRHCNPEVQLFSEEIYHLHLQVWRVNQNKQLWRSKQQRRYIQEYSESLKSNSFHCYHGKIIVLQWLHSQHAVTHLLSTDLEEESQVVTWENDAFPPLLFCVDVDSSHENRVGAVDEYQKEKTPSVGYPVTRFRFTCAHGRPQVMTGNSVPMPGRHLR